MATAKKIFKTGDRVKFDGDDNMYKSISGTGVFEGITSTGWAIFSKVEAPPGKVEVSLEGLELRSPGAK